MIFDKYLVFAEESLIIISCENGIEVNENNDNEFLSIEEIKAIALDEVINMEDVFDEETKALIVNSSISEPILVKCSPKSNKYNRGDYYVVYGILPDGSLSGNFCIDARTGQVLETTVHSFPGSEPYPF